MGTDLDANWDDLRTVLVVKRAGSLTRAAERLGVTRTTVGRRLRRVEDRLRVRLFDRTPEGLQPTESGLDLLRTAQRVEDEILASERRLLGREQALGGPLRVSTVDFVYAGFAAVFATFVRAFPDIQLTVDDRSDNVSLLRREADVVLRMGNEPSAYLVGRRVARLHFALFGQRAMVDRIGRDAPLSAWPWLSWDERTPEGRFFDAWLAVHAPGARVVMRVSTFSVGYRSVREGVGLLFLPTYLGEADPALAPLGVELAGQDRDLWVLTLAELRDNRRIRAFMEHAYASFAQPGLDRGAP